MIQVNPRKAIALYLAWIATLCAALVLCLAEALPFRLTFVRPDNLLACLTLCQLCFILLAWPLFASWVLEGKGARAWDGAKALAVPVGVLLAAALPLVLVCSNISDGGIAGVAASLALAGGAAAVGGAVVAASRARGWRPEPWYFLAVFLLSAAPPLVGFLANGGSFLRFVSPFWGALEVGGAASFALAAGWSVLALIILLAGGGVDAPAPAK
jgi:hypothetical protein